MNIIEMLKGIAVFILFNMLIYFAWELINNLFSLLDTEGEAYLKTIAWISFLMIYFMIGIVYPASCILAGTKDKETDIMMVIYGGTSWLLGTIACLFIYKIAAFLESTLPSMTITGTSMGGSAFTMDNSSVLGITIWVMWIIVLFVYVISVLIAPIALIAIGIENKPQLTNQ